MSTPPKFNRRTALMSAAALPLAAATATQSRAAAPMLGVAQAPYRRVKVGSFEVTTLLAGTRSVEGPHSIFGLNVDADTFNAVSADAGLSTDAAQFFFTPTLVNNGSELVLFDTGLSGAGTVAAIEAAGYTADQVDKVVITHMHGDHIGGLSTDGTPTFANAAYVTGAAEFDAWSGTDNENFDGKVAPLAEQMTMLDDGGSPASGITAMAAFGHTPGHMVYMVEDGGTQLVIGADFANHYVWSLAHPDWEVRFDMDKEAAAATRKQLLDMMATDRTAFIGYHMPWPGIGYVVQNGEGGYRYEAHSYQLML
ncbi:MBL fold metallo-hydrolase [Tateyamaria omphalii]|uniref:MBL fold metallo-hydrolase n=1 Tax=Tateyamaria omphalii TaxID=299262 RepID=A0A1P8MZQ2_9RHOB|nr:MBL fold metallo-hydrolase [Tateyamaria omphalii]APX13541.1 MBL fold metallo-hydrolase [Tateyamaria omphalii]